MLKKQMEIIRKQNKRIEITGQAWKKKDTDSRISVMVMPTEDWIGISHWPRGSYTIVTYCASYRISEVPVPNPI
jgi:hypothetical protein